MAAGRFVANHGNKRRPFDFRLVWRYHEQIMMITLLKGSYKGL